MDIRHLDQIQEQDQPPSGRGLGAWLLGAAGVGALILTAVFSMPSKQASVESTADPLSELIARAKEDRSLPADQLSQGNASFAHLLTDKERPSTALVAVKSGDGSFIESEEPELPPAPPPGDQLPVVPLPAGKLLESTQVTGNPRDGLTELAADRAQPLPGGERAEPGRPGDFQIQVASFRDQAEADAYVEALRLRGHSAYREAARVPNRGIWHRVRIGPFKNKYRAQVYKAAFEAKESMATFVVDPEKVEQRQAQRAARAKKQR